MEVEAVRAECPRRVGGFLEVKALRAGSGTPLGQRVGGFVEVEAARPRSGGSNPGPVIGSQSVAALGIPVPQPPPKRARVRRGNLVVF